MIFDVVTIITLLVSFFILASFFKHGFERSYVRWVSILVVVVNFFILMVNFANQFK